MVDLRTRYLGLELANPLVPSASPLSRDLDAARRLEDAGAAALVMYSLFEEEVDLEQAHMARFLDEQTIGHAEAETFLPQPADYRSGLDDYLEQLARLKKHLDIPVIASLNGVSLDGWVDYGKLLEEAGADALELNVYHVAADVRESGAEVEARYVELLRELRGYVRLPVTMKLSHQFSAPGNMIRALEEAGADGVGLFNRFYQPDIDLETLEVRPGLTLSDFHEALLRVRWTALLRRHLGLSIGVTGGFHTAEDALKGLLAGADVIHQASALLMHGPEWLTRVRDGIAEWMAEREYASVSELRGSMCQDRVEDPVAFERANYVHVLDSYTPPPGVLR